MTLGQRIRQLRREGFSPRAISGIVGVDPAQVVAALADSTYEPTPSGGSVSLLAQPAESYTFTSDDLPDPASFWSGYGPTKILPAWTPTVSGKMTLQPSGNVDDPNWSNFFTFIFKGSTPNVSYPDLTADSSTFDFGAAAVVFLEPVDDRPGLASFPVVFVEAGQEYTVIILDESGTPGNTMVLDGLYSSLAAFGGIDDAPFPPHALSAPVIRLPDGSFRLRPDYSFSEHGLDFLSVQLRSHDGWPNNAQTPQIIAPLDDPPAMSHTRSGAVYQLGWTYDLGSTSHAGPHITAPLSRLYDIALSDFQFGMMRLDGTAQVVVGGSGVIAAGTDGPDDNIDYNVDTPLLDWTTPLISTGSDLAADATNRLIKTTAGGRVFVWTRFTLSVGT